MPPESGALRLARLARLAWREGRAARRHLLLYMSPIAIGVAALVAIDSFAGNVTRSVREQSRTLLGGDVQLSARQPFAPVVDSVVDSLRRTGIPVARGTTFPSMAIVGRTGGTRLVQVRGVDPVYPLYGRITTAPANQYARLQDGMDALVDPAFLIATDGRVGDTLSLGAARFAIAGTLVDVPGTTGITAVLGPRVYVARRFLDATKLIGFGTTAEYSVLLKLPDRADGQAVARALRQRLRGQYVNVRTITDTERTASQATETLSTFIGVVGLVALLLGGVGVASGVRAFVARKIDTVAVLRCLGASSGQVLAMYVVQAAAMGLTGAAVGAALGVAVQFALPRLIGGALPVDVSATIEPGAIASGIVVGGWIALIFAMRPLLALRGVSPLQTLRRDADAAVLRMHWRDAPRLAVNAALVASVVFVAVARSRSVKEGLWISAATGGVLLVLAGAAALLAWLARRSVRDAWPYVVRQGVTNVHRPGNQTRAVVLALGFGAFLLTTLYLVQANLLRTLTVDAAASGANLLFFDVQDAQAEPLDSLLRARHYRVLQRTPVVPMRIAAINGQPVGEMPRGPRADGARRADWALRREYRSTFRDSLLGGETLVEGRWFARRAADSAAGHTGEVSLDRGVADELKVKLGDVITWDVQGLPIDARVTSLREIRWTRFEPNFFAVFEPRLLREAPKQYLVLADVPRPTERAVLQRDVVRAFPNVSAIDLTLVAETVTRILSKVTTAIEFMAAFSLAMGIPVLFSAVAATRRDRIREGVLLKTLGATRRQIARVLATEYALLGVLGSLTGLILALGGGWALTHFVFGMSFTPVVLPALGIAAGATVLTVTIGLLAGRDVFRETAMSALRDTG